MDDRFVSRGGSKLQAALDSFNIEATDKVIMDVGCSTGGFVDCWLQHGASKVYAVDTAYGELAWKLRNDPKVVVMERTNILHLSALPSGGPDPKAHNLSNRQKENEGKTIDVGSDPQLVDFISIDAGWTKLGLVLPVVKQFLKPNGQIIALLKPHYELPKAATQKGVVPLEMVEEIKTQTIHQIQELGFNVLQTIESPILGGGGNVEYLLLLEVN